MSILTWDGISKVGKPNLTSQESICLAKVSLKYHTFRNPIIANHPCLCRLMCIYSLGANIYISTFLCLSLLETRRRRGCKISLICCHWRNLSNSDTFPRQINKSFCGGGDSPGSSSITRIPSIYSPPRPAVNFWYTVAAWALSKCRH